jgi:hypothetical protein
MGGDQPPGFIPFDQVGNSAFAQAMSGGADPMAAFQAATQQMTQLGMDNNMPQGGWQADMQAAAQAFQQALANGATPEQAFQISRQAGAEAASAWATPPAPPAPPAG